MIESDGDDIGSKIRTIKGMTKQFFNCFPSVCSRMRTCINVKENNSYSHHFLLFILNGTVQLRKRLAIDL